MCVVCVCVCVCSVCVGGGGEGGLSESKLTTSVLKPDQSRPTQKAQKNPFFN